MVNTGKRSRACATCKKRKIKCDLSDPACSQCTKAGWTCPGPQPADNIIFQDETKSIMRKIHRVGSHFDRYENRPHRSKAKDYTTPRSLSPSVTDRGTAFFLYHYVLNIDEHRNAGPARGLHEYLPALMRQGSSTGVLQTVIAAAGLAALATAGKSGAWGAEAYQLYSKAIRQLKVALSDPLQLQSDCTLAAIMLMGTFEAIASGDAESMQSFSRHTIAAARVIEARGPFQFRSEVSVKLYIQLRRIIVMTNHQLQETFSIKQSAAWAEQSLKPDEAHSNRFAELNEDLAFVRAEIKRDSVYSPSIIAAKLMSMDERFEHWKQNIPETWAYKSHLSVNTATSSLARWEACCEAYPDLWIASVWNNYRCVKLLIHEAIVSAIVSYGTAEDKETFQASTKILAETADSVCHSVAYLLGDWNNDLISQPQPIPGGYLLIWPLYLAGMLRTTPKEQRSWIADKLQRIGLGMGLKLAISMANMLRQKEMSFSDSETWLIGEFYP